MSHYLEFMNESWRWAFGELNSPLDSLQGRDVSDPDQRPTSGSSAAAGTRPAAGKSSLHAEDYSPPLRNVRFRSDAASELIHFRHFQQGPATLKLLFVEKLNHLNVSSRVESKPIISDVYWGGGEGGVERFFQLFVWYLFGIVRDQVNPNTMRFSNRYPADWPRFQSPPRSTEILQDGLPRPQTHKRTQPIKTVG